MRDSADPLVLVCATADPTPILICGVFLPLSGTVSTSTYRVSAPTAFSWVSRRHEVYVHACVRVCVLTACLSAAISNSSRRSESRRYRHVGAVEDSIEIEDSSYP